LALNRSAISFKLQSRKSTNAENQCLDEDRVILRKLSIFESGGIAAALVLLCQSWSFGEQYW